MTTCECKCFGGGEGCRKWKKFRLLRTSSSSKQKIVLTAILFFEGVSADFFHEVFGCYTDKHHKKLIREVTLHYLQEHLDNTENDVLKMNKQTVSFPKAWPEGVIMTGCIIHSYLSNWYAWRISQVISLVLIFMCIYTDKVCTLFLSAHMYSLCVCTHTNTNAALYMQKYSKALLGKKIN